MKRLEAEHLRLEGTPLGPWAVPYEQWPPRGVPRSVFEENRSELTDTLRVMREAAAMGDVSVMQDHVTEALVAFGIQLDEHSSAYIKFSTTAMPSAPLDLRTRRTKLDQRLSVKADAAVAMLGDTERKRN